MLGLGFETLIALAFILALTAFFHTKYDEKTVAYAPTILTTLGIFATFLGIALGLLHFDSTNIEASVPDLLQGLKTAFWASVAGVGAALSIKLRHYFFSESIEDDIDFSEDSFGKELLTLLKNIQYDINNKNNDELISQVKLFRQDTKDYLDKVRGDSNVRLESLRDAQIEALEKLTEMSSKTLVEALRDVIRDFNDKITEQFGENFKELNQAVGKLLVWQEEYKVFLINISEQTHKNAESMRSASNSYETLVGQAGVFNDLASQFSGLLSVLENQKSSINTMLKSLGELLVSASGSIPEIEKKIVDITDQLNRSVKRNQEQVSQTINDFDDHVKKLVETTGRQSAEFNAEIEKALTESLKTLGGQLAAMTEKFANDYDHLAVSLKKISELTKRTI